MEEDAMSEGTVKWFNSQKGQKVSFDLERGQQGKTSATNLKTV
jgi:cold shock CspA family protein